MSFNSDGTPIKEQSPACAGGAHPRSSKDGPYRWRCHTCNAVWFGPNY